MTRPRLLLVPQTSELQWTIKPQLEQWAEVASYDAPGIGDEPAAADMGRQAVASRGLAELERRGWERFFLLADGWAIAAAVRIAEARPADVEGVAFGHATLSYSTEGERPSISREVLAAMTQLIEQDAPSFIRYGMAQLTKGSFDEGLAGRILERVPQDQLIDGWKELTANDDFEQSLRELRCPMLLAKHEGCLLHTDEGFEDAAAALPAAVTVTFSDHPSTSPEFAEAVREFCLEVAPERA